MSAPKSQKSWQKILGFVGIFGVIFAAGLLWHREAPAPEETIKLENNYPIADYIFEEAPPQKPQETPQNGAQFAALQAQLDAYAATIAELKKALQNRPQEILPPPPETPQKPARSAENWEALAARIHAFAETETPKDWGAENFANLAQKDSATHENKLARTITADRMIPAFLVTPISSQLAGKVTAQVESDIFANMGRAVLIPKGSKVIGYYSNNTQLGEYRLDVVWTRIITPQGVNIMLTNAKGADIKGYNGLVGEMISRNFQRYGLPLLVSTISNGLLIGLTSALANRGSKDNMNFFGDYLLMQLTRQTGLGLNQIINQILRDKTKIKPIIIIREGSRVFISPNLDIFFPIPKNGEINAQFFREP